MKFFSIVAVALSAAFAAAMPAAEAEAELVARQGPCSPCQNGIQLCYNNGVPVTQPC